MGELNESHHRHLVSTFHHVDEVLSNALHAADATDSPFCACQPDLNPSQRELLRTKLKTLRSSMQSVLTQQGMDISSPLISESWLVRTAIVSARIEIEEIRSRYLRSYGVVPVEVAQTLDTAATKLLQQLAEMEAILPLSTSSPGPQTAKDRR